MRTREDVERDLILNVNHSDRAAAWQSVEAQVLIVELLLDMRDLLAHRTATTTASTTAAPAANAAPSAQRGTGEG